MAIQPNYFGAALIKVDYGSGLASLGYTANGADLRFRPYYLDVPGDQNGGDAGPPIDQQLLGQTCEFTLEMTKWEPAVSDAIAAFVTNGSAGIVPSSGTLMIAEGAYMRLLVLTPLYPINFPITVFNNPIEINRGVRFGRLILSGMCHMNLNTRVLYNNTTT